MDPAHLRRSLDDASEAEAWLEAVGFADAEAAHANLVRLAGGGLTLDLLANICGQFSEAAPSVADPDRALNNLERFINVARNPLALAALFERDPATLPNLLQLFSTSQYLSDLLVTDGDAFDLLRMTQGRPVQRDLLVEELIGMVESVKQPEAVMNTLRRAKRREMLRIAYGDIVRNQTVATVSRQISFLADSIVEAALNFARPILEETLGVPQTSSGQRAGFVVLALGKLGGTELNYSSGIVFKASQVNKPRCSSSIPQEMLWNSSRSKTSQCCLPPK